MYESIHVRITKEQYEWLRQYCFENRVAQAEVVREALDIFKNQKGEEEMKGAHDYTYVLVTQTQLMHPELDDSEELTEGEAINLIRDFDGVETNKGIWAFPDGSQLYRKGGAK